MLLLYLAWLIQNCEWFGSLFLCPASLTLCLLWPQLFAGTENTARTGLCNYVLGQHFLLMAISNYFRKTNRAEPELESISSEFTAVLQASL